MPTIISGCVIFLILMAAYPVIADDSSDRKNIDKQVSELLNQNDYVHLEKLASEYRTNKTRTSGGAWKLTLVLLCHASQGRY